MNKKSTLAVSIALAGLLIQFIPSDIEPQVNAKPIVWDSPQTQSLAERSCMPCHGGTPPTPWYTKVAPVSWFTNHHVNEGREKLDFATRHKVDIEEITEEIHEGEMPLGSYTWLHPEAKLSPDEQQQLIDGIKRTFAE